MVVGVLCGAAASQRRGGEAKGKKARTEIARRCDKQTMQGGGAAVIRYGEAIRSGEAAVIRSS